MKVLYIDVNCKFSSTGKIVYDLFSMCKTNGIKSAVCYGRGPKIKEKNIYKFGLDFETYLHAFLTRITGYTGCFSYFSTKRLINFIKRFNPDVVHIHELHAYFVNIKQLLSFLKKNKYKVVFTNHCEFLYTGKCGHSKECNKYHDHCGNCPHIHEYPKSLLFDHTKNMLLTKRKLFDGWEKDTWIVSPSRWLDKKVGYSFLTNFNRSVINNGIDTKTFEYKGTNLKLDLGIPRENKVVLAVAPNLFSENKGGDRFLSIASKMIDRRDITFVGVGRTDKEKTPVPANTIIFPLLSNKEELIRFYSMCDVLLILSKYENYPTTSLEAQCCGAKVIGYDVGGVSETILEGNGGVVPFNDEKAIIKSINNYLNENYNHAQLSSVSKEYFSKERMYKEYMDIYKKLCC